MWREAELKHGRVAMVAILGMIAGENVDDTPFHLFDGKVTGPAIYQFQEADTYLGSFWEIVLFIIALIEGQNILSGWESVAETTARATNKQKSATAELKDDYINGDLGFDPLGLSPEDEDAFEVMRTKELNNGSLSFYHHIHTHTHTHTLKRTHT